MTMNDAKRISDLLVIMKDAREWRETFEQSAAPFIGFEDVVSAGNVLMEGPRDGWQGSLRMDTPTAVAMMKWLEAVAQAELFEHGVTDGQSGNQ